MKITVEGFTRADPATAWLAYNTPAHISRWNAASPDWHSPRSQVDLREGGHFSHRMEARDGSMGFDFEGQYTHIELQQRIDYRMADGREATVQLKAEEGGTRVSVVFDAEKTFSPEQQQQGWQAILDNFCRYADTLHSD